MPLTGVDPNDPTPSIRREIILGAGESLGAGGERYVLIYGNKTSAGSETATTIGDPIQSDQDCKDRFGARSEIYQQYRTYTMVDQNATIYAIAVAEPGGGSAGTVQFTFATAATDTTTVDVKWGGFTASFAVASGDSPETQATNLVSTINNAEQGTWPFTAAVNGGDAKIVDVTCANTGDRGNLVLNRLRVTYRKSVGSTCTKGSVTNGSGTDDFTNAFAAAVTAGTFYYQISPKHATGAVTATDNGIGEHITNITTQALPINGRSQLVCFGLVGTNSQAIAVATSSAANSSRAFFWWQENNDWTPGMLAAHCTAVMRQQQILHPSANLTGYANGDSTPFFVPPPNDKNDVPTTTEIRNALNNGICPISFTTLGAPFIVRQVTSKSLVPGTTTNDYRVREGHIPSAIDFAWEQIQAKYAAQRQPFLAADPPQGQKPLPKTTYPSSVRGLVASVIDDLTSAAPVGGTYLGPILDPSTVTQQKNSIVARKITGGISVQVDLVAVEHNNKAEFTLRDVSAAQ